jgi:hypothetical protein
MAGCRLRSGSPSALPARSRRTTLLRRLGGTPRPPPHLLPRRRRSRTPRRRKACRRPRRHRHGLAARRTDHRTQHTLAGSFIRYPGDTRVDGSLLWIAVPFGLIDANSDLYRTTVDRIRQELYQPGGGVRRYLGDTFYGDSEWILLAASLGWSSLALGDRNLALTVHAWIDAQADDSGYLPEQVANNVQSLHMLGYWRARWGNTAAPLLWSHAMYIVLTDELDSHERRSRLTGSEPRRAKPDPDRSPCR